jgi:hypothetical protein
MRGRDRARPVAGRSARRPRSSHGPKRGQFAGLGDIAELAASFALELPPPVAALLKGKIVDQAADAGKLSKQDILLRGWGKLVSKAANDHSANLAVGLTVHNLSDNADIRRGRHVVYDLHTHLVFVTKYRRDALSELAICDLRTIFTKVCKDFEAACCVNGGQRSMRATRTVCSGPHPTASRHAQGLPCRHSPNTSNPSGNHPMAPLAYLPGLNPGVSREGPDD